ncbi:MAG: T9SS type A sorting domain-containing protein [Haliscomenobacter sp.]|uniref:T9SS type A sorting domain-containing protein n=1 Tax=Haliscomenobacter sp. TaxID=2717303 RepID=UPI0029AFFBB1|nr:T9SS type A sorting domain-containing protein [Haliscomenobacter sp.]MDX2071160.1 T9SS type A sorting domain-containing protein [Haliscomenobacter sp.]
MKTLKFTLLFLVAILNCTALFGQKDSIFEQGEYRNYIVYLPKSYKSSTRYPLVLNLHGLNSNAAQQQAYSQFDKIADTANFIVVYPNAIGGSWSFTGDKDVNFLTHLVDSLKKDFSINNSLFATGMSMGGFMSYRLACAVPLKAIGVVSGNMSTNLQNNCPLPNGLPVIHFHGTTDPLVNYNGTIGIPPVETTIKWWVDRNKCTKTPIITPIPNSNANDGSTAEQYAYGNGTNKSEVIFYKITNGGHTWPGAPTNLPFGNTNQDLNASQLIWAFFKRNSSSSVTTAVADPKKIERIKVFPNPTQEQINVRISERGMDVAAELFLYNSYGQMVFKQAIENPNAPISIQVSAFPKGVYLLCVKTEQHQLYHQKIVVGLK